MSDSCDKNQKQKDNLILIFITLFALSLVSGFWYLNFNYANNLPYDQRGTFGDMFGAVNSVFSGLAFAGIIITIYLQGKELGYQREELKETRKEFIQQNETLKLQRFENTFFKLIELQQSIVNNMNYAGTGWKLDTSSLAEKVRDKYNNTPSMYLRGQNFNSNGREIFLDSYRFGLSELEFIPKEDLIIYIEKVYDEFETSIGLYFRNLSKIISFIEEHNFYESKIKSIDWFSREKEQKEQYIEILKAQLSDYELIWLFYLGFTEKGIYKWKPLIEKYNLLENLSEKLYKKSHSDFYDSSAFKAF